jgi:hypothetical protein
MATFVMMKINSICSTVSVLPLLLTTRRNRVTQKLGIREVVDVKSVCPSEVFCNVTSSSMRLCDCFREAHLPRRPLLLVPTSCHLLHGGEHFEEIPRELRRSQNDAHLSRQRLCEMVQQQHLARPRALFHASVSL